MLHRILSAAAALTAAAACVTAFGAHAAGARPIGGHCTTHYVFYDVTDVSLDERISAHWSYDSDTGSDEGLGGKATLDTVMTGAVRWHQDHASTADRRRHRQVGIYDDLTGQCRVPDYRQGQVEVTVPGVAYTLDGTWATAGRSGTCHTQRVQRRRLVGQLIRLSLDTSGRQRTVGFRWNVGSPPDLDCPFQFASTGDFSGETGFLPAHLRGYSFVYAASRLRIAKRTLTTRRVVTIPIDITSRTQSTDGGLRPVWDGGRVQRTMRITGSVTLRRHQACAITPRTDLLKTRCGAA